MQRTPTTTQLLSALYLAAEPDCCRVITGESCEIIQRVPAAADAIRRIGSTDPAALLFDAMEAFEEGDPKADENIRSIERFAEHSDHLLLLLIDSLTTMLQYKSTR